MDGQDRYLGTLKFITVATEYIRDATDVEIVEVPSKKDLKSYLIIYSLQVD